MVTEIAIPGIFAILVIREVFNFLGRKGMNGYNKKIEDLHDWHSPDQDGEQSWKGKQLERILTTLDANVRENTKTTQEGHVKIVDKLEELKAKLKR